MLRGTPRVPWFLREKDMRMGVVRTESEVH